MTTKQKPKAGAARADRPATKPDAADYVTLKIADLDLKGVGNVRDVDQGGLGELVASIKSLGVLEPVVVRERDHRWELVAGFRRVAAAKKAGLTHVPARILELDDAVAKEVQLTENLQRTDLTPLEEGAAIKAYLDAYTEVTQMQLGKRLGKSQPYIANRLRLMAAPEPVKKALEAGTLSPSHGEVFLSLPKEATPGEVKRLLDNAVREGQSTGQLTQAVKWKSEIVNRRTQAHRAKARAKATAKFPDCPKKGCGKQGRPDMLGGGGEISDFFKCSAGHYWSPKTGALTHTNLDAQQARDSPREPAKPTLPEVHEYVEFQATPAQIVDWLTSVSWTPVYLRVHTLGNGTEFEVSGRSSRKPPAGIPVNFSIDSRAKGEAHVPDFNSWNQQTDTRRKIMAAKRDALAAWSKKVANGGKKGITAPSPKGKVKTAGKSTHASPPAEDNTPPPAPAAAAPPPVEPTTALAAGARVFHAE